MKSSNNSNEDIFPDHYKTLGIDPSATITEIKEAFQSLTQKIHFDNNSHHDTNKKIHEDLNYAYDILSDPILKEYYDGLYREKFFIRNDSQDKFTDKNRENTFNAQDAEFCDDQNIFPNYYKTLEIDQHATLKQIKKAYRSLMLKNHPDKHPNLEDANKKTQALNEAYGVLSDSASRAEYDKNYNAIFNPEYDKDGNAIFNSDNFFNMNYSEYENNNTDSDISPNTNSYWGSSQDSSDDDRPPGYFKVNPEDGPIYVPYVPYEPYPRGIETSKKSNYLNNNMFQSKHSSQDKVNQDKDNHNMAPGYIYRRQN